MSGQISAVLWLSCFDRVMRGAPQAVGGSREAACLEGGALRSWKLVGGGGQSHCQELGSNSSPIPLAPCRWEEATELTG